MLPWHQTLYILTTSHPWVRGRSIPRILPVAVTPIAWSQRVSRHSSSTPHLAAVPTSRHQSSGCSPHSGRGLAPAGGGEGNISTQMHTWKPDPRPMDCHPATHKPPIPSPCMPLHFIPSHLITFHPIPSLPIPTHPTPFHHIPSHFISSHPIVSPSISFHSISLHPISSSPVPLHLTYRISTISPDFISSLLTPFHPIACHCFPFHTIPFHPNLSLPIPSQPLSYHHILSHPIPSISSLSIPSNLIPSC